MADTSRSMSIGGSGKWSESGSSSDTGGITSTALAPNIASSRMYLVPLRHGPADVGVGLGPVADLVAAQRVVRRRADRPLAQQRVGQQHLVAAHLQVAQQPADPVQHAAGVVAGDGKRVTRACNAESFRARRELVPPAARNERASWSDQRAPPRTAVPAARNVITPPPASAAGHTRCARRATSSASMARACRQRGELSAASSMRA